MSTNEKGAQVIIKRKKIIAADGHHGGAWKVAYADFVTAMMAFFMLMWLLNATTEQQREGIANYFSPSLIINPNKAGGTGSYVGETIFADYSESQNGVGASMKYQTEAQSARGDQGSKDSEAAKKKDLAKKLEEHLLAQTGDSAVSLQIRKHVVLRVTDEGTVIEIFDRAEGVLFTSDDEATPLLRALMVAVTQVSKELQNTIAIKGFVRSDPVVLSEKRHWDSSLSRVQTARLLMHENTFDLARI
jgi:chemotaxis protein MotB